MQSQHLSGKIRRKGTPAFTLIELLIVVSIISILAAIAVPNFLEAQTRAKVSRVKADMRSLSVAVESYIIDHNKYPHRQYTGGTLAQLPFPDSRVRIDDMKRMTTPIAYITTLPIDIFEKYVAPPNNIFDYWAPETFMAYDEHAPRKTGYKAWLLVSVGPDQVMGTRTPNMGGFPSGMFLDLPQAIDSFKTEYDVTNGTISIGNVSRSQSQEPLNDIFPK